MNIKKFILRLIILHLAANIFMTVEEQILLEMGRQEISINNLSNQIGISCSHLLRVLKKEQKEKRNLTDEILKSINEFLGTDFKKKP